MGELLIEACRLVQAVSAESVRVAQNVAADDAKTKS
jgi:hypothetical protein